MNWRLHGLQSSAKQRGKKEQLHTRLDDRMLRISAKKLTTAITPSGFMIAFKSSQNSEVKICFGTAPPEKQSCTTMSYSSCLSSVSAAAELLRFCVTQPLASSKNTLLGPGSGRPKYWRAAE
jgi:hypothetical protein